MNDESNPGGAGYAVGRTKESEYGGYQGTATYLKDRKQLRDAREALYDERQCLLVLKDGDGEALQAYARLDLDVEVDGAALRQERLDDAVQRLRQPDRDVARRAARALWRARWDDARALALEAVRRTAERLRLVHG